MLFVGFFFLNTVTSYDCTGQGVLCKFNIMSNLLLPAFHPITAGISTRFPVTLKWKKMNRWIDGIIYPEPPRL